jgi:hypothetical protein
MSWGSYYWDTGVIVNGINRYGIIQVASLSCGNTYYANSRINNTAYCFEIQVFDPSDFQAAGAGAVNVWDVQPRVKKIITLSGLGTSGAGQTQTAARFMVSGAAYDPTAQKLYLMGNGYSNGSYNRLYRFSIADNP